MNLGGEGVGIGEFLFRPKKTVEFQIDFFLEELTGEVGQMGLDASVLRAEGGTGAEIDGGGMDRAVGEAGPAGIDPVGRKTFILGGQVRGGKADLMAPTVARFDLAENGEGAAEHGGGVIKVAGLNGGADATAADAGAMVEDGGRIIEQD